MAGGAGDVDGFETNGQRRLARAPKLVRTLSEIPRPTASDSKLNGRPTHLVLFLTSAERL